MAHPSSPPPPPPALYRLSFRDGAHLWTFAFTPADAPVAAARVQALMDDPDAPLDVDFGRHILRHVERVRLDAVLPQT